MPCTQPRVDSVMESNRVDINGEVEENEPEWSALRRRKRSRNERKNEKERKKNIPSKIWQKINAGMVSREGKK